MIACFAKRSYYDRESIPRGRGKKFTYKIAVRFANSSNNSHWRFLWPSINSRYQLAQMIKRFIWSNIICEVLCTPWWRIQFGTGEVWADAWRTLTGLQVHHWTKVAWKVVRFHLRETHGQATSLLHQKQRLLSASIILPSCMLFQFDFRNWDVIQVYLTKSFQTVNRARLFI